LSAFLSELTPPLALPTALIKSPTLPAKVKLDQDKLKDRINVSSTYINI